MADIRINQLPAENSPVASEVVAIDGSTTRKTTIQKLVAAGRPLASQSEAEAGTDAVKAMTPLTTAQAIGALGASAAQGALANTAMQPDVYDPDGVEADVFGWLRLQKPTFLTLAALQAVTVPAAVMVVDVFERTTGSGGRSLWKRSASNPSVPAVAKTQDAGGAWWTVVVENSTVSIATLGAVSGANSTTAVQGALDLIEALGGGVIIVPPPASPHIMDEVKIGDDTELRGIGKGVVHFILNPSAAVGANVITNKNHTGTRNKNIKVHGLGIDGNRTNRPSAADSGVRPGHNCICLVNTDNPVVTENYVKSATLHGINVSSDNENRDGEDAYKTTGVKTCIVSSNYVTDCGDDNITTHWSGKLIITNNFSWSVSAAHGDGSFCIEIDDGSEEFIVTGNHCWDALNGNSGGIAITSHADTPAPRSGIVTGNYVTDCRRGIMCRDGGSIESPTSSPNARNIVISNNVVRNCREFHINIGTYEQFTISGNIITGGDYATEDNRGLYITANVRHGTITGNTLTNFNLATYAIDLATTPQPPAGYFAITGNSIRNTMRGIRANRPGLIITGNVIDAGSAVSPPSGIFVDSNTANSIIANNMILGFTAKINGTAAVSSVVENNVG